MPDPREPTPEEVAQADAQEVKLKYREARKIDLTYFTWNTLENLKRVLRHEDFEETITLLADIGDKMVQLTTAEDRRVKMFGQPKQMGPPCPTCRRVQQVFEKEASVKLGQETPPKKKPGAP